MLVDTYYYLPVPPIHVPPSSFADSGSGIQCFLMPGSGIEQNTGRDLISGINISVHITGSLVKIFWVKILKFFVNSGFRIRIRDVRYKSRSRINISDPQHCHLGSGQRSYLYTVTTASADRNVTQQYAQK